MGEELAKWADVHMYDAQEMPKDEKLGRVMPRVHLLSATPDPLGAMAAAHRLFAGKSTRNLGEVTDEERRFAWEDTFKTRLRAPLEFIDLHFFIEGVSRAFTHQMVRQRTAVYAQESLRFAVKRGMADEVAVPPTIVNDENAAEVWTKTIKEIEAAYEGLINAGIPAEDARALLPHATTTRLNYKTNMRNLLEHAGNRLCTQAQFEWRVVFLGIMSAISNYKGIPVPITHHRGHVRFEGERAYPYAWQFELIGTPHPETFAPICYQTGKCEFKSRLDRTCHIRDRVNDFEAAGIPSSRWSDPHAETVGGMPVRDTIVRILPEEWMTDYTSARRERSADEGHIHPEEVPCFPACPMHGAEEASDA